MNQLPLYITGHSLGGALAVVATWYQSSQRLAACYTFGAPRVCNEELIDWFKTPIYRVVNGPDPVSFVPPTRWVVSGVRSALLMGGKVLPPLKSVATWLDEVPSYRHVGHMLYLGGNIPTDGGGTRPKVEFGLSGAARLLRYATARIHGGKTNRIDAYHNMQAYREKLKSFAKWKNG